MKRLTFPALILAIALAFTACGSDDDDQLDSSPSVSADDGTDDTTDADTDDDGTTTSTVDDGSDTTDDSTDDTTDDGDGDPVELPGEPWDGFADAGDRLAVLGVAADDVLNVRAVPGTDAEIVATLDPTATDVIATGEARGLPQSFWYEVEVDGQTGWVSVSFVAYEAGTDDATAEFLDGGAPPEAETMVELGELVAAGFASVDPASRIVQSVAPTVGDLGEVTYDVVGLGDDSGAGFRLHIFAAPSESGDGFVLKSIERTVYCLRGLAGELCT